MRKIMMIALLIPGFWMSSFAQKRSNKQQRFSDSSQPTIVIFKEPRFLLNVHSGYSAGLGSSFNFYPDEIRVISILRPTSGPDQRTVYYNNPWKGLGDGFRFGGGIAYVANDFINLGVDVDYFKSSINKLRDSSYREIKGSGPVGQVDDYSYKENLSLTYKTSILTITPAITFKAISKPKWFIYNKIGIVLTFNPNNVEIDSNSIAIRQGIQGVYSDSLVKEVRKYEWMMNKPAAGFMGAFGIQFKLIKRLRGFAEIQFSHIVFVVRKKILTEYILNGKDALSTLPMNKKETDFVKQYSSGPGAANPAVPSEALEQKIPITSLSGQVGLVFQF
ncbi:MAG: hypothetical protein ABIN94_05130 [Ferruginibacter sp.]